MARAKVPRSRSFEGYGSHDDFPGDDLHTLCGPSYAAGREHDTIHSLDMALRANAIGIPWVIAGIDTSDPRMASGTTSFH